LAREGVEEARAAGRLLKLHGFEFDIVYTSWLSRAIETALYVLDELDSLWLPMIKTWRLNERMYGALTGLSKQMVKQRHGEKQFKAWRRGYTTRPPPVSSFSQHYPGNDRRYVKYLNDVRFGLRESAIRSIELGRPTVHRKLPKAESLKDCMDRTIPFFTEKIIPEAVDQGKRVLISSSENAIRGLLMHLCEIPEDKITGLEIPNGLPIIFDIKSKCVKLLDDGSGLDPLEVYNFGKAAPYLFRPCEKEDGSVDEECGVQYASNQDLVITDEELAAIESIKGPKQKQLQTTE
jgi:2,3-bisphosphoglycerate-dependent phosphoglycerate mutase